jgi:beta-glucosidase
MNGQGKLGTPRKFPAEFAWGAASSSYQIEGAAEKGGKGPSVWDAFCKVPGAVHGGHTGDVACDHIRLFQDDVRLMHELGIKAYRLSINWPRVLPDGVGKINDAGLRFYSELVDALLDHGIEPWITLFHWEYPLSLQRRGGWLNPLSPAWFEEYTQAVVSRLSDRVTKWITFNEPQVFLELGHGEGKHAPGLRLPLADRIAAAHNVLLAHGRSVRTIRQYCKTPALVGWAPVGKVEFPATDSPEDIEAARKSTWSITKPDLWNNTWYGDPICLGHYPEDGLRVYAPFVPKFEAKDFDVIRQPLDFYGLNIYSGTPVSASPTGEPIPAPTPPGYPQTTFRWNVAPESLRWGPRFLAERYKLPIVITENGMAGLDWEDLTGRVRDPQRIDFTRRYLLQLSKAIEDGVDVRGYFHWSIMDNFEWAEGYKERFGLVYVDFQTQKRTPKDSAYWYREVIRSNGLALWGPGAVDAAVVNVRTSSEIKA